MTQKFTPGPWRITHEMRGVGNVRTHGVESAAGHGSVANCGSDDLQVNIRG